jgi:PEGA domain-containing protein
MSLKLQPICCLGSFLILASISLFASDDEEKTLRIESDPPGAHVIINGRDRGITPFEWKLGRWAFETKKSTAFSKRLSEPVTLQVSKDGYRTETLDITRGPFTWHSLNRRSSYNYWVINSPTYNVRLRPTSRVLTNADVIQLLKGGLAENLVIDKIQTSSCEFRTDPDDITALHKAGLSDVVISAMMHALPQEQSGPPTSIQPTKK